MYIDHVGVLLEWPCSRWFRSISMYSQGLLYTERALMIPRPAIPRGFGALRRRAPTGRVRRRGEAEGIHYGNQMSSQVSRYRKTHDRITRYRKSKRVKIAKATWGTYGVREQNTDDGLPVDRIREMRDVKRSGNVEGNRTRWYGYTGLARTRRVGVNLQHVPVIYIS